jgi:hypothetical protein
MTQIEQWFSILQGKRWRISDFSDLDHLAQRTMAFVLEWNAQAHPFNWSSKSAARVMVIGRYSSHLGCGCMTFELFLHAGVRSSSSTCDRCVMVELTIVMAM